MNLEPCIQCQAINFPRGRSRPFSFVCVCVQCYTPDREQTGFHACCGVTLLGFIALDPITLVVRLCLSFPICKIRMMTIIASLVVRQRFWACGKSLIGVSGHPTDDTPQKSLCDLVLSEWSTENLKTVLFLKCPLPRLLSAPGF